MIGPGLSIPKTEILALAGDAPFGGEMLPDPAFENPPDWTMGTGVTVGADGIEIATGADTSVAVTTPNDTLSGDYIVEVDVVDVVVAGGGIAANIAGTTGTAVTEPGVFAEVISAGAESDVSLELQGDTTFEGTIGSISVRPLL